jgi:hypothetical protein
LDKRISLDAHGFFNFLMMDTIGFSEGNYRSYVYGNLSDIVEDLTPVIYRDDNSDGLGSIKLSGNHFVVSDATGVYGFTKVTLAPSSEPISFLKNALKVNKIPLHSTSCDSCELYFVNLGVKAYCASLGFNCDYTGNPFPNLNFFMFYDQHFNLNVGYNMYYAGSQENFGVIISLQSNMGGNTVVVISTGYIAPGQISVNISDIS